MGAQEEFGFLSVALDGPTQRPLAAAANALLAQQLGARSREDLLSQVTPPPDLHPIYTWFTPGGFLVGPEPGGLAVAGRPPPCIAWFEDAPSSSWALPTRDCEPSFADVLAAPGPSRDPLTPAFRTRFSFSEARSAPSADFLV